MSVENIQKMIIDEEVKFVDLRFCDTAGKEQHVSMPVGMADEDFGQDVRWLFHQGLERHQ